MRSFAASRDSMQRTGVQDEAFTMLRRGHKASIDRHIWVNLDACDSEPERLQQLLRIVSESTMLVKLNGW